eukprot:7305536-Pyramimonas_sp.AAC.1
MRVEHVEEFETISDARSVTFEDVFSKISTGTVAGGVFLGGWPSSPGRDAEPRPVPPRHGRAE